MAGSSLRMASSLFIPLFTRPHIWKCRAISSVPLPNILELCDKARLSLTRKEIEEIGPQISSVVDWFAQLQSVDLEDVAPAIRVGDTESVSTLREDVPSIFPERDAILSAVPQREGPYIKVPKILKENAE